MQIDSKAEHFNQIPIERPVFVFRSKTQLKSYLNVYKPVKTFQTKETQNFQSEPETHLCYHVKKYSQVIVG